MTHGVALLFTHEERLILLNALEGAKAIETYMANKYPERLASNEPPPDTTRFDKLASRLRGE